MKRAVLIFAFFYILVGCSSKKEPEQSSTVKEDSIDFVESKREVLVIEKGLLRGVWGYDVDENASFRIKGDSMYLLEAQDNPAHIQIVEDTLVTDYGGGFLTRDIIINLSEDSLFLVNELQDTLRLVRFK